ncbi:NAD(P)-binding protein [Aspergillus welwitschiae]|uniref:NAD(P)-binding protein n=1 Tax=Aspergillus welwitschiae TaxID=1341132 RepID=A0A3F3PNT1_9EURO|nr:NAD(P)-binding protein [Aspergillus welwitschiae]RDH28587.1 NAD(P)-binding protein [Aspergillus welwitschiae]
MLSSGHSQHVLLTGANGFVASHILFLLLEAKADDVIETHPDWKEKVNFVIVSDFTSQKPFNTLFEESETPFDYVIHAASPFNFGIKDFQKDMIEPAVKGTTQIMESAHQHGGSTLKRFVLLGSGVSVLDSFQDIGREGNPYTEKSWNPVTVQQAIDRNDTVLGYSVSKTQAERKAREFMQAKCPKFDLTVINPVIITGPMIHPISGKVSINESNHFAISSFIDGTHPKVEDVRLPFYHFVDVRDVARSHVDALTNPAAGGQRILLVSGLITPQLVVNIVRRQFPKLRDNVPAGKPDKVLPEGVRPTGWDTRVSLDVLSKGKGTYQPQIVALLHPHLMLWQLQHNAGYLREDRLRKFWKFEKNTVLRAVERTDRIVLTFICFIETFQYICVPGAALPSGANKNHGRKQKTFTSVHSISVQLWCRRIGYYVTIYASGQQTGSPPDQPHSVLIGKGTQHASVGLNSPESQPVLGFDNDHFLSNFYESQHSSSSSTYNISPSEVYYRYTATHVLCLASNREFQYRLEFPKSANREVANDE